MSAACVLKDDEPSFDWSGAMEFRLVYRGPLLATQGEPIGNQSERPARADNKHHIRQQFHRQLKNLWQTTRFLKRGVGSGPVLLALEGDTGAPPVKYDIDSRAQRHAHYGFNFVPLVTQDLDLMCSLDILFLRPDRPQLIWAGDIDNRIKTLFDAMKIPDANEDYSIKRNPGPDELPFFVLLEKDELITKIAVETDQLLDTDDRLTEKNSKEVHLIVTVRIRPYEIHADNMQFA